MNTRKKIKGANVTKEQLKSMKLETSKKGFTLWSKDRTWILDGSCLMEDGKIFFANNNHKDIQVVIRDSEVCSSHMEITLITSKKKSN